MAIIVQQSENIIIKIPRDKKGIVIIKDKMHIIKDCKLYHQKIVLQIIAKNKYFIYIYIYIFITSRIKKPPLIKREYIIFQQYILIYSISSFKI